MGDQKKGFDPLASLFDGPDLQALPEVDEDEVPTMLGTEADVSGLYTPFHGGGLRSINVPEATDVPEPRSVNSPAMVPEPPAAPAPAPAGESPAAESEAITEGTAAPTPVAPAPEAPEAPAPEDKAALAKRLAVDAIARAKAAAPPAPPAEDRAALAKRLAAEAIARAAAKAPPAPPAPAAEDKAALARKLAAEAIARAKARPQAPATAPKPTPKKKKSRLSLAERASRPTSAADAMRNAKAREEQARQEKTAAAVSQLPQYVANLLAARIRGVASLKVVNAVVMNDREILLALWKGHRARLAAQGDLAECVAITQVIGALDAVEQGRLIAAIAETSASDYLVWIDASHNHVIAAFPNAREWYSKLAG